jgi:hypothetical protein
VAGRGRDVWDGRVGDGGRGMQQTRTTLTCSLRRCLPSAALPSRALLARRFCQHDAAACVLLALLARLQSSLSNTAAAGYPASATCCAKRRICDTAPCCLAALRWRSDAFTVSIHNTALPTPSGSLYTLMA